MKQLKECLINEAESTTNVALTDTQVNVVAGLLLYFQNEVFDNHGRLEEYIGQLMKSKKWNGCAKFFNSDCNADNHEAFANLKKELKPLTDKLRVKMIQNLESDYDEHE